MYSFIFYLFVMFVDEIWYIFIILFFVFKGMALLKGLNVFDVDPDAHSFIHFY